MNFAASRFVSGAILAAAMTSPATAANDPAFDRAVQAISERTAAIDQVPDTIPGRAVIAVHVGESPVIDVKGTRNVETGAPADAATPFYIASMTKAFVGLLAVRLDRAGVMPLDATIGEFFPDMQVEGLDAGNVTMRQLLSHQEGFKAPALNIRTAYTDAVPPGEVTSVVNASAEPTGKAFSYTNLGYLIYAAALEQKTGKSWKLWLEQEVLSPLGMDTSSARTSDLPASTWLHERFEDGWIARPPKTDAIMHAAGGLVVSPADMARWLLANAGGASAIPREDFRAAQANEVKVPEGETPLPCHHYALGWAVCDTGGLTFLEHSGTYPGMRGEMVVIPSRGVGFSVLFNSDSMTGSLGLQLVRTFVASYLGETDNLPPPAALATRYREMAARYREQRTERRDAELAKLQPAGGEEHALPVSVLEGRYRHPALGTLSLASRNGRLVGDLNGMAIAFRRGASGAALAHVVTTSEWQTFVPVPLASGKALAIDWGGDVFTRIDD